MLEKLSQTQGSLFCPVDTSLLLPSPSICITVKMSKFNLCLKQRTYSSIGHRRRMAESHTPLQVAQKYLYPDIKNICVFPRISSSVAEGVKWGLFVCGGCPSAAGWWRCVLVVEEGSMHLGPVRLGSSRARHCPACRHCLARPQGRHQPTTLYANTSVNSQHCSFLTGNMAIWGQIKLDYWIGFK